MTMRKDVSGLHVAEYCDAVKAQLSCKALLQKGKTQPHIPADYRSDGVANFLSQVQLLSRRRSNCVANFMSRHKNTNFAQNPDRCSTPIKKKKLVFSFFWSFTLERDIAHHVFVQHLSPFKPFFCLKQQSKGSIFQFNASSE